MQQRAPVEEIEHFPVAFFGGAVGEHGAIERRGRNRAGDDGGGSGDESVKHNEVTARGCA